MLCALLTPWLPRRCSCPNSLCKCQNCTKTQLRRSSHQTAPLLCLQSSKPSVPWVQVKSKSLNFLSHVSRDTRSEATCIILTRLVLSRIDKIDESYADEEESNADKSPSISQLFDKVDFFMYSIKIENVHQKNIARKNGVAECNAIATPIAVRPVRRLHSDANRSTLEPLSSQDLG